MMDFRKKQISELETKCLAVISRNFERFFVGFKLRNNSSTLAGHLELLALLYTEILIERLKEIFFRKPKYLDFFINRHLKKLDLRGAYSYDPSFPPTLLDKLRTYGENILSLEAISDSFQETFYESLMPVLPNVEHIQIADFATWVDNVPVLIRILQSIGRNCPCLQVLKFNRYLKGAPANEFHDSISFVLKHCPRLEILQFYDSVGALYNLHKGDLELVKGKNDVKQFPKYALKTLLSTRRNYPIGDALEICSVLCPYVSSLVIEKVECDQDLDKISRFTHLEDVILEEMNTVSPNGLNQFLMVRGSTLISLELSDVSCLSIFTLIESCPKLQKLNLSTVVGHSCSSSNEQYKTGGLRDLRVLSVSNCNFIEDGVAEALKSMLSGGSKLEELCLYQCSGLTYRFFNSLGLHELRSLTVSDSDIEMDPFRELQLCGSIQHVHINSCRNITLPV